MMLELLFRALACFLVLSSSASGSLLSESTLRDELMGSLTSETPLSNPASEEWQHNQDVLRDRLIEGNIDEFRDINVVTYLMEFKSSKICSDPGRMAMAWAEIRAEAGDDIARYAKIATDSLVGGPQECVGDGATTMTSLQQAYLLARAERASGVKVTDADVIVEFGGGTGRLSSAIVGNLDWKGLYIIWDLPVVALIQKHFLRASGVRVYDSIEDALAPRWKDDPSGGVLIVSQPQSEDIIADVITRFCHTVVEGDGCNRAFLSFWSLSETPSEVRVAAERLIAGFDVFFVVYQEIYCDMAVTADFLKEEKVENDFSPKDVATVGNTTTQRFFMNRLYFNGMFQRSVEMGPRVAFHPLANVQLGRVANVEWSTNSLKRWYQTVNEMPVHHLFGSTLLVGNRLSLDVADERLHVEIPCDAWRDMPVEDIQNFLRPFVGTASKAMTEANRDMYIDGCRKAARSATQSFLCVSESFVLGPPDSNGNRVVYRLTATSGMAVCSRISELVVMWHEAGADPFKRAYAKRWGEAIGFFGEPHDLPDLGTAAGVSLERPLGII